MYALIKKVTTNHNMWPVFSTNVSLRLQSYFRLFLLHGHLKVMRTINIWTRYIGGYIRKCTTLCVKALDSLCTFSISRGHFKMTFEINQPQKQPTLVGNWVSFVGLNHFYASAFRRLRHYVFGSSVRPSVRPKPEIPSFDLYMGPLVHPTNRYRFTACPSIRPSVRPSVRLSVRPSGEVSGHLPENAWRD